MDYGIVIAPLAYFLGIHCATKLNLSPIAGALIAAGVPFLSSGIISWIISGTKLSTIWGDAVNLTTLTVFALQLILMYLLLRYLQDTESITAYIVTSVLGFFVIVISVQLSFRNCYKSRATS